MTKTKRTKHLHEKRGISFADLGALLGTRALLAGGHEPFTNNPHNAKPGCHEFNMQVRVVQSDCGTVSCIGGTMEIIRGGHLRSGQSKVDWHGVFHDLFYPKGFDGSWDWIVPKVAVKAIDNWLATGQPHYDQLYAATPAGRTVLGRLQVKRAKRAAARSQQAIRANLAAAATQASPRMTGEPR